MNVKRLVILFVAIGFVTMSAYAQSVKPRAGEYLYESDSSRHWIGIENEGDDRYSVTIVSTSYSNPIVVSGAYWRPGSGAIEFVYNGRTVQIRAQSGGRSISCSLFRGVNLRRS
jgi:hypothetical protein